MSEFCLWCRGERGRDHIDTDATLRSTARARPLPKLGGASVPRVSAPLCRAARSPTRLQSSDVVRLSVVCGVDPQMARLPWRRPRVSAAQGRSPHPLIIHSAPLTTHMMCVCESCAQAYPLP